ncbi:Asp-tRNA(Asn)/Glu-tRNA(Gln) amidotransferase GatCAB subunit C [bacterium]|nr:Asp-tRNA(Asn)/Glu-tRNA(Gln) amidotransferase GatCAB subunit C [bacterium]
MSFNHSDLDRIIHLAHLNVDDELKQKFLPQIQSILNHMESINQFDLSQVPPAASAFATDMPLRDDVVIPPSDVRLAHNAPVWAQNAFVVPRIS